MIVFLGACVPLPSSNLSVPPPFEQAALSPLPAITPAKEDRVTIGDAGEPDPIDALTGENWVDEGVPPERRDNLSTPSYNSLSDEKLWAELNRFKPVALVALKRPSLHRGVFRRQVLLGPDEFAQAVKAVLAVEGVHSFDPDDVEGGMPVMSDGRLYPAITILLGSIKALSSLRELDVVDYIEPLYFEFGIGCSEPDYAGNADDGQFTPMPGRQRPDLVPWSFSHMGIPDAWGLFNNGYGTIVAPGRGVKIGVVDTGTYPAQAQLRSLFALPTVPNNGRQRPLHRSVTVDPTVYCNHGTRIAGLAAAPADGTSMPEPNVVGVAWGSDLVTVKIGDGVVHTGGRAIVAGLDRAVADGAKVITLAFGMPIASSFVSDNITRIFDDNSRVILVGAAGTSVPSVTFPASMDREVTAVSIVDFAPGDGFKYRKMTFADYGTDQVAYGPEVDFVAVASVQGVPTLGNGTDRNVTTVGGSSSATAQIAGILALAWSRSPQLTRADLLTRVASSSSHAKIAGQQGHLGKRPEVGWGIPDAYVAAGGARRVSITGPLSVPPYSSYYTLSAVPDGAGSFSYQWDSGETTSAISPFTGYSGSRTHTVTVRNPADGKVLQASHTVAFAVSHYGKLYSDDMVSEWASWLIGKRVDRIVNQGVMLPSGCSVISARGLEYESQAGSFQPRGAVTSSKDNGYNGFTVSRPGGLSPQDLTALAHVWHDGTSAIRMRVVYEIWEPNGTDCRTRGAMRKAP